MYNTQQMDSKQWSTVSRFPWPGGSTLWPLEVGNRNIVTRESNKSTRFQSQWYGFPEPQRLQYTSILMSATLMAHLVARWPSNASERQKQLNMWQQISTRFWIDHDKFSFLFFFARDNNYVNLYLSPSVATFESFLVVSQDCCKLETGRTSSQ